jgi:DNA (cytosine-5)-methyltransferase 1
MSIPVIDLFAGPGGLGEGFSALRCAGRSVFGIKLSIEMEANAFRTLTTRAFFRQFYAEEVPEAYYDHLRGDITQEELFDHDEICREAANAARREVHQIRLGNKPGEKPDPEQRRRVKQLICEQVKGHEKWVLIGGPPCQAYSLAGRSRMLGVVKKEGESDEALEARRARTLVAFEGDHRHLLYKEYLSIIADHWPPVFVMENVKGILSAKAANSDGQRIFPIIRKDLSDPNRALNRSGTGRTYAIHSLSVEFDMPGGGQLNDRDYLIQSEEHGIPQRRHRVILLGIRSDIRHALIPILEPSTAPVLRGLFNGLPRLTAGVSKPSGTEFGNVLKSIGESPWLRELGNMGGSWSRSEWRRVQDRVREALRRLDIMSPDRGKEFYPKGAMRAVPGPLGEWLHDSRLGGVCNHSTRSHMVSDLHRYLFCSAFASELGKSPKLQDLPESLLPNHENVKGDGRDLKKHADRFRAQIYDDYSATITCHISQDGHAFIHPDPNQMRSLTVREAARIQTFPDNYFFEGTRTAQYKQVGNAVPPFLAHQIAKIVTDLF